MNATRGRRAAAAIAVAGLGGLGLALSALGPAGGAADDGRPDPFELTAHGPAAALDVWAEGDVIDVLWAVPRRASTPGEAPAPAGAATGRVEDARASESGWDLFHARSRDGGRSFGSASAIGAGWARVHNPHRGTDPQLAAAGDRLVAVWTAPGTSRWGSGPLASAVSNDGGRTWRRGPNPADDGSTSGHGFIDVAADGDGVFHAVWLDGRSGFQGLRTARSEDGGSTWQPNAEIDARTCECCWNDLTAVGDRLAVLYRDHEPRDMAVAVSEDGGRTWSRRGVAGDFGWEVEGCPHVGGGLAGRAPAGDAAAAEIHALVWTGAEGRAGLYQVWSGDGGRSWSEARALGSPRAKHGDLAGSGAQLHAAWDDAGTVYAASAPNGTDWTAPVRLSAESARASHPLVVAVDGGALVLWTEREPGAGGDARWVSARIDGPGDGPE